MTDTNQLPEPELGYIQTDKSNQPAFSARQMREAMGRAALSQVQGDPSWWMRETDEGAEWTDTAPLVLSGWTPLYTTPQPAQATQAEVTDSMIREAFLANGFTIKDGHSDLKPYVYAAARAILALRPVQVPMTDELFDLICNAIDKADTITMEGDYMLDSDDCIAVVRVMQALLSVHHGITAQAKKGGG